MVKFPKYSEVEKGIFKRILEMNDPQIQVAQKENFEGTGIYVSICSSCSAYNQHEVILNDLGERILKLKCPKCNQYYPIRPSPIVLSDEGLK